tara:strand:- start:222 stop:1235 length:1014 start_codon:yes stop_codon:yes gene_type:complete
MKIFGKNLSTEVAIVAEIGVNHEGDVEAASRMVRLAAGAGADAVKLQTYTPKRFLSASDPDRLDRVTRFGLNEAAHRRLAGEAADLDIPLFSAAITEDVIPLLDELCPAIKIASGDLDFEPVIRAAAQTGKPIVLSTGCGTTEEIDRAIEWIRDEISDTALYERVVLLHCISSYPTPIEETNVRSVPFLAERYGLPTGYSHHAIGVEPCFSAIALGACMVEAHFTDSKEGRSFRDHELSLDPSELEALVTAAPRIKASLGILDKVRQPCEAGSVQSLRKGIVASRNLRVGTILSRDDLMYARPATEFTSSEIGDLIGRTLTAPTNHGETILRKNVSA